MSDSPPVEHGEDEQDARAIRIDRAQGTQVGDHATQSNRFAEVIAGRDALISEGDIHLHVHVEDAGGAVAVTHPPGRLPARKGTARVVIGDIPRQSAAFQDRPEILRELLHPAPDAGMAVVFAVTGLRGVGKSQLAAACARRRLDAGWRMVAWLNAEDREQLLGGFVQLAAALGLNKGAADSVESAARVRSWLEADGNRCLLVLDNATDADLIQRFLPAAGRAHVIITSFRQSFAGLGIPVEVDVFSGEQAAMYLAERTALADQRGAAEVSEELGCLPLALAQAAAVVAGQRLDYATYLRRLAAVPAGDYLARSEGDLYPRGTAEAIIMSVDAAQQSCAGGLCREVLEVVCLLSSAGTPRALLPAAVSEPDVALDQALQHLAGWSLLSWSADGSAVAVHRLVMRVVRERASREGTLPAAARRAVAALRTAMPPVGDLWPEAGLARELVEQITALTRNLAPYIWIIDGESGADLLLLGGWAGWYLTAQKDSSRAIPLLEKVMADRDKLWGPDDRATLTARSNLASAYLLAGRVNDALLLQERNLADAERLLGPDHRSALTARGNLASTYEEAGRLSDAMPLLKRSAADAERLLGPDDPWTLAAVNNLANGYRLAGRYNEAIRLHRQNLTDRLRVLGPDHPYTLTGRNNLANALLDADRFREAIPLYEQNLADRLRVLGPDHRDTLQSRNNLANAYLSVGRLGEAIRLHQQALAERQRILGLRHPETLISLSNLSGAYYQVGRFRDAIPLLEQAVAGSEQTLGTDHPTTREYRKKLRQARR
jgi:tetratricopeptide (TPR) repeat protein